MKRTHFCFFAFLAALYLAQVHGKDATFWVKSVGDRTRIIHENELSGTIDLATLADIPHLYALGPMAGLQGEVTIYDGLASIARIRDGRPSVSEALAGEAIFLVYASAPEWRAITLEKPVESLDALAEVVKRHAETRGLDIHQPFPFRIEGAAESMTYHIIWKADDKPHNKHEHHKSKRKFTLRTQEARFIGFWVDKPRVGKLTHPGKRTHVHMQLPDNQSSGHVDALALQKGAVLYLPEP